MKTIISIGFALVLGWAVLGHGTANAQGSPDTYAFNPYTMSKKPVIQDGFMPGHVRMIILPVRITPEDGFPQNPNSWYTAPNNDPNQDAMPKIRVATYTVKPHKPY